MPGSCEVGRDPPKRLHPAVCFFARGIACLAGLGRAVLPCFLALGDARLEEVSEVKEVTPIWLFVATSQHAKERAFAETLAKALRAEEGVWKRE